MDIFIFYKYGSSVKERFVPNVISLKEENGRYIIEHTCKYRDIDVRSTIFIPIENIVFIETMQKLECDV